MLLEGLHVPLTTPFYSDGRLNLRKLEHNVDRYSKTPVAGMAVLGAAGEPTMLSDEETRLTLRTAMEAAADQKVMLAGVSRDSVVGTLELVDYAASLSYDAVLVKVPGVLDPVAGRTELLTYFRTVADRAALPVVLYGVSAEVAVELAVHPRIVGAVVEGTGIAALRAGTEDVKHEVTVTTVFAAATGRMLAPQAQAGSGTFVSAESLSGGAALAVAPPKPAIKTRTKIVGFQILTGDTARMLQELSAGAVGAMPRFSACAPQACYEVLAAWKDGDLGLAEEKQARLQTAVELVEGRLGVPGIKFGCDLNGYFGGRPRLPLLPPREDARKEIAALMQGLRN